MRRWRLQWLLPGLFGMLVVLLAACSDASASAGSAAVGASSPSPTGTPMPCPHCPPGMMAPGQLVQNGQYSDERFIDMMVPHHLMAIQMARVAQKQGEHAQIKQLAANIITTQGQEITELKALKKQLYGTADTPTMMNPMQMDNTGMLMPDQLAKQHPFDQAFIDSMIAHHASAIDMASVALQRSSNPDIKRIARNIVNAQSAEIGQMIQWRQAWYPAHLALIKEDARRLRNVANE